MDLLYEICHFHVANIWILYPASDTKQSGMCLPSNQSRKYAYFFIKEDKSKALRMIVDAP
jgi:hypothetical protein